MVDFAYRDTVESYPKGYPSQAAFQSSESSFSIYRSFDYLHSRVILELQDELRVLESDLSEIDEEDGLAGDEDRRNIVRSREMDLDVADSEEWMFSPLKTAFPYS